MIRCPTCGGRVHAIATDGPESHVLRPCGHTASDLTLCGLREEPERELVADGGLTHGDAVSDRRARSGPRQRPHVVEKYPKSPDDCSLPAELEFSMDGSRLLARFIDTGIRVEINGEVYVPDAVASIDGYVKLAPAGNGLGRVQSGGEDVRLYADMTSDIVASGGPSR